MKRFQSAVQATEETKTLLEIAEALAEAAREAKDAGVDPATDPAVLLLGALVSFHTHADVNSFRGYQRLIDLCSSQLEHNGALQ